MMHSRSLRTLEVCLIALSIVVPCRHSAADVINLAWDPATEQTEEAVGYRIYVGTASGSYSQNVDVGIATTFRFSDAVAGQQVLLRRDGHFERVDRERDVKRGLRLQ